MHVGCLGVVQTLLGSVLHELTFEGPFHGAQEVRVQQVFAVIKRHYARLNTPTRLASLCLSMFAAKDQWSSLSAKAAVSQHLLYCMQYVLEELHDGSNHHEHRLRATTSLVRIYRAFKDSGMVLQRHVALEAMKDLRSLYSHWHWLLCRSMEQGELNWAIMPKMHVLYHIVDHSKYLNPVYSWCYEFEDHMHAVVLSAKACVAGSRMHLVGNKVVENDRLPIALTFAP